MKFRTHYLFYILTATLFILGELIYNYQAYFLLTGICSLVTSIIYFKFSHQRAVRNRTITIHFILVILGLAHLTYIYAIFRPMFTSSTPVGAMALDFGSVFLFVSLIVFTTGLFKAKRMT